VAHLVFDEWVNWKMGAAHLLGDGTVCDRGLGLIHELISLSQRGDRPSWRCVDQ
jgi:hypothetical protein